MNTISKAAGEALTQNDGYNLVKLSSGEVIKCTARADVAIGAVAGNAAPDGDYVNVILDGIVTLISGEAIAVGEYVCPGTTAGTVLDADTTADAIVGIALTAAGAAGESMRVQLFDYKGNTVA